MSSDTNDLDKTDDPITTTRRGTMAAGATLPLAFWDDWSIFGEEETTEYELLRILNTEEPVGEGITQLDLGDNLSVEQTGENGVRIDAATGGSDSGFWIEDTDGRLTPSDGQPLSIDEGPGTVHINGRDPQTVLDNVAAGTRVVADPRNQQTVADLTVSTDNLHIEGLNLLTEAGTDATGLLIDANGVTVRDLILDGNKSNQGDNNVGSGVEIRGNDVTVERFRVSNTNQHGVFLNGNQAVEDVTVQSGIVQSPDRDGVSTEGPDNDGALVENVRVYNSADRGAVEVTDGCTNTTVRDIYADGCAYVVAIQDHGGGSEEANKDVLIEGIHAVSTTQAIEGGETIDIDHRGITIRDVGGSYTGNTGTDEPIFLQYMHDITLEDINLLGHDTSDTVRIDFCTNITVRDCTLGDNTSTENLLRFIDCDDLRVKGGEFRNTDGHGVRVQETDGVTHNGVTIQGITTKSCGKQELEINGAMEDLIVTGNHATVTNDSSAANTVITNNL